MKKVGKIIVSTALVSSMMFSVASCSLFDKAGKLCTEVGDEFMGALIDREAEDMSELCTDEDEALDIFTPYCGDMEAVEAVLSRATFEAGKPACKTKDKKGEIEYTITLPDYESCLDEDPEDVDELEDLLDDTKDTIEIKVTLEFKLQKDDWLIDNPDEICEEVLEELYDVDWGFGSPYANLISSWSFFGSDNGVYDSSLYALDLDVYFTESIGEDFHFVVERDGVEVFDDYEYCTDYAWCYCHDYDLGGTIQSGNYTYYIYDESGALVLQATCTVE